MVKSSKRKTSSRARSLSRTSSNKKSKSKSRSRKQSLQKIKAKKVAIQRSRAATKQKYYRLRKNSDAWSKKCAKPAKKGRVGPRVSATCHPVGTIKLGINKKKWIIQETRRGVQRWVPWSK